MTNLPSKKGFSFIELTIRVGMNWSVYPKVNAFLWTQDIFWLAHIFHKQNIYYGSLCSKRGENWGLLYASKTHTLGKLVSFKGNIFTDNKLESFSCRKGIQQTLQKVQLGAGNNKQQTKHTKHEERQNFTSWCKFKETLMLLHVSFYSHLFLITTFYKTILGHNTENYSQINQS